MNKGLYQSDYEHDACGVGMIVNIHGNKSHELVDNALKVLENMRHRGAEGADNKTGDGAGIMLQIPHEFILLQGIPVPEKGKYGTGLVFLPKAEEAQQAILSIMIEEIEREGLSLMHLRTVPTCPECLGEMALAAEPAIKQLFVTGVTDDKQPFFERTLYIIRKKIERRVAEWEARYLPEDKRGQFYICSLSSRNIVYKGMLSSLQLRQYFPDLTNVYFTSGLAWCIAVSPPTPSPPGASPSPSVCCATMARSTPSGATGGGCRPASRCSRPRRWETSARFRPSYSRA